jgi:hypothetical protein
MTKKVEGFNKFCNTNYGNYLGGSFILEDFYAIDKIKDNEPIKIIINAHTGDIESYIYEGDRIVRNKSVKSYSEMEYKYEPKDDRDFTKMFHEELQNVTRLRLKGKLSIAGELLFRTLGDYVDYSGDNIVKSGNMAMGTKTIGEKLLGYGKSQTIVLINELLDLNLIAKVRRGKNVIYVMNPLYYNKGKVLKSTVTLFKVQTDSIEWDKEFLEID